MGQSHTVEQIEEAIYNELRRQFDGGYDGPYVSKADGVESRGEICIDGWVNLTAVARAVLALYEDGKEMIEIPEGDILWHTTAQAVPGGAWRVHLRHLPYGYVFQASSEQYKSQLQAKAALLEKLSDVLIARRDRGVQEHR